MRASFENLMNLQVSEGVTSSCLLRASAIFILSKRSWSVQIVLLKEVINHMRLGLLELQEGSCMENSSKVE